MKAKKRTMSTPVLKCIKQEKLSDSEHKKVMDVLKKNYKSLENLNSKEIEIAKDAKKLSLEHFVEANMSVTSGSFKEHVGAIIAMTGAETKKEKDIARRTIVDTYIEKTLM